MPFLCFGNSRSPLCPRYLFTLLLLCLWLLPLAAAHARPPIELHSDSGIATAGYYRLSWQAGDRLSVFRLLESDNPRFTHSRTLYQGPDLATVLSGKPNGNYYYRVALLEKGNPVAVSNTIKVTVKHHSLSKALAFFAVGALVFLATLLMILRGNRNS